MQIGLETGRSPVLHPHLLRVAPIQSCSTYTGWNDPQDTCHEHRSAPIIFAPIFYLHLISLLIRSFISSPFRCFSVHLSRWYLTLCFSSLLTVSPSAMRAAFCAARPFIRQPLIQPDSFLLLCPIRLLILRAALRSFLVAFIVTTHYGL